MKKLILLLLLLVAIMPQVHAAEKQLYNSWHYFEDEFVFQEKVYAIKMFPGDVDRLKVSVDDENYFIDFDPDKQNCAVSGFNKICYYEQSYEFNKKSSFDDAENQVPGVRIAIFELYDKTSIEIRKTVLPTKLHIGERGTVSVTITNKGEIIAYDMFSQEFIPEGLKFFSSSNIDKRVASQLQKNFNLPPGKSVIYTYDFDMQSFEDQESLTNLSWTFEDVNTTFYSDAKLLIRLTGWKATYAWERKQVDVDETVSFVITLDNDEEESSEVKIKRLHVKFPKNLIIVPVSTEITTIAPNEYVIEDSIQEGRIKKYSWTALAEYTGEYLAQVDMLASSSGGEYTDLENVTLKVGKGKIVPLLGVSPEVIRSGNDVTLLARIENEELDPLYKVSGVLSGDGLFSQDFSYEKVNPSEIIKVNTQNKIRIPISQLEQTYVFTLNGTYETATGEKGLFHTQQKVGAKPGTQSFEVNINPEKKIMNLKDENTVTVTVKNLLGDGIPDLQIKDSYNRPITLVTGQNKESLELQGGTSKQAYIYKFKLPSNFPEDSLEITTELSSATKNYREIYVTSIDVNRTIPLDEKILEDIIEDKKTDDNNDDQAIDDEESDNNSGGESGFWASVKNFFSFLFTKR